MFIGNRLPSGADTMGRIHEQYKTPVTTYATQPSIGKIRLGHGKPNYSEEESSTTTYVFWYFLIQPSWPLKN